MSRKQHNNEEVHNCSNGKDATEGVVRKERQFSPKRAAVLLLLVYFHRCREKLTTRGPLGRPTDMALGSRKNENSFVTKRGREKERAPFFWGGEFRNTKTFFCCSIRLLVG